MIPAGQQISIINMINIIITNEISGNYSICIVQELKKKKRLNVGMHKV